MKHLLRNSRTTGRAFAACALLIAALLLAPTASAYYHFTRYNSRTGPFVPIVQKFDLNALSDRTVQFFISDQQPSTLAPGDSYAAVVSQIRAAAAAWNEVSTSDLRVMFGGLRPSTTANTAPAIEVVFDEIAPGVIAYGGPVVTSDLAVDANGNLFQPIVKSQVVLGTELMRRRSYTERFFLTVVHEFGHALGLQHSWSSGVMSTELTRATTKAAPLAADDAAGLSVLYPSRAFAQSTGSIAGRVALGGSGVPLASVVALTSTGPAVSTLTHPDGTYRIDGLTPGAYTVYAHPLPPALDGEPQPVNVVLPSESDRPFQPGPAFDLQFYPQSRVPSLFTVNVSPGSTTDSINFQVQQRARVSLHSAQTYSFYGSEAVKPAHLVIGSPTGSIVLFAYGASTGSAPVPGLSISVLNAPETVTSVQSYVSSPVYLQVDVRPHVFSREGVRHLLFSAAGESYVLPAAFAYAARRAPAIASISPNPDRTVTITGNNLGPFTSIFFDGAAAPVQRAEDGLITVTPPPAPLGHRSTVTAFNSDGQSSLMIMGAASPTYAHDNAEVPQFSVSPSVVPAGVETTVEITGSGAAFTDAFSRLGFGTSDISVKRLWVAGSRRLLANISVHPSAVRGSFPITSVSGIQTATLPGGIQIIPSSRELFVPLSTTAPAVRVAGTAATLPIANLPFGAAITATVDDRPAQVLSVNGNLVTFQIPNGLSAGPAVVRFTASNQPVLPITIQIDPPPAVILGAQTLSGVPITGASPARPGDAILLLVSGLSEVGFNGDPSTLKLTSGESEHLVQIVQPSLERPGTHLIQVLISPSVSPGQPLSITLSTGGRPSQPFLLAIR